MRTKKVLFVILTLGVLLSAAGGLAQAIGRPVSSWLPISPVSNDINHLHEWHPAVAYNSQWQEYLVAWDQNDPIGDSYIYGQFVSRDGALIGSRFLIPALAGSNTTPDVAYNPTLHQYLVVFWHGTSPEGIYGQRLSEDGTPVGSQITFASSTTYTYRDPAVVYAAQSGKYLVVWQKNEGSVFSGIEARTLSGDGTTLGGIIAITGMQAYVQPARPDVAYARTIDECLVVWDRWYDSSQTDHDIQGQRIHMAGVAYPVTPPGNFDIHNALADEIYPVVAAIARPTGIGQYLVVCEYDWSGSWIVAAQSLTDMGAPDQWISVGWSNGGFLAVAGNENTQEYLVAWPTLAGTDMQASTVSTGGSVGPIALALPSRSVPGIPAVASGPLGDYLVTCQDYYPGYPIDIFGYLWSNRAFLPLTLKNR